MNNPVTFYSTPERHIVTADSVLDALQAAFTAPAPRIAGSILHYWWVRDSCHVVYRSDDVLYFAIVMSYDDDRTNWIILLERTVEVRS